MHLLVLLSLFYRPEITDLFLLKSLPFHIPENWKRHSFRAEQAVIGSTPGEGGACGWHASEKERTPIFPGPALSHPLSCAARAWFLTILQLRWRVCPKATHYTAFHITVCICNDLAFLNVLFQTFFGCFSTCRQLVALCYEINIVFTSVFHGLIIENKSCQLHNVKSVRVSYIMVTKGKVQ